MRVLLDTTFARRGPTGTGVYLERLSRALAAQGVEVVEAADSQRRPPAGGGLGSVRNLARDRWWVNVELPRRARDARADVLHHPLPALAQRAPCAQVVTIHDLAFERLPQCFDAGYRRVAHAGGRRAARGAQALVCVSETTAQDVRALWGVAPARIVVARHGPGQEPAAGGSGRGSGEHLLYVGDGEPRKNLAALLAAHRLHRERAERPLPLVLAGAVAARAPGVRVEARPGPERLEQLYGTAVALVHPALHEGFGLTLLEAMGAGTPVLAACSPGVREVCGDGAEYFDPRDVRGLAAAIDRVAGDEALRGDLRERGRRRAAEFSWARSARRHVEAYTLAAERNRLP